MLTQKNWGPNRIFGELSRLLRYTILYYCVYLYIYIYIYTHTYPEALVPIDLRNIV